MKSAGSKSKLIGSHVMMLKVELIAGGFCLRQAVRMLVRLRMVRIWLNGRPAFLVDDPVCCRCSSSLSELSAKVKMALPFHRLIIGLIAWDASLQLSSRMSGSPPLDASMISVVVLG